MKSNAVTPRLKHHRGKTEILFIVFGITVPIITFLLFYVYTNASSIGMAFTTKDGALTLDNFVRVWEEVTNSASYLRIALKNTLITFLLILITYPFKVLVSYFLYKKVPFSGLYKVLFFLPILIPGIVVSLVFTRMVSPQGMISHLVQQAMQLDYAPELLADSRFANITVLVHMLWLTFPGDIIIWGGTFARIPEDMLEAGQIDGASWWTEFTKIIVPMVWPTVALQMVLMTCAIFGSSGAVFLLTKGEYHTMTISAWMYIMLYQGSGAAVGQSNIYNFMSALGLCITTISVAISLVVRKFADNVFEEVEF